MSGLGRAFFALALASLVACRRPPSGAAPTAPPRADEPSRPVATTPGSPPPRAAASAPPAEDDLVGEAPENNPTSETVMIKLVADPARKARVFWGRKDLGLAPLELTRPRHSGPLDLVVVAPGALPLHTRVFTDRDDKVALRLYAESEAPALLGYHPPDPVSITKPPTNSSTNSSTKPSTKPSTPGHRP